MNERATRTNRWRESLADVENGTSQIGNSDVPALSSQTDLVDHQMTIVIFVMIVNPDVTGVTDIKTIAYNLEQAGYQVITAADGVSALQAAQRELPDLIILDLMLPEMDGIEVCRQLRQERNTATTPIMILTAKGDEIDKVVGLEVGTDDYVTKPFGRRELLARVRALMRRADYTPADGDKPAQDTDNEVARTRRELVAGPLRIDLAGRRVYCRGQEVELQAKQFELLTHLARNRGTVLTRDQLLHNVWGYDYIGDTRTVDVHIRWLCEKLEEDPANPHLIQTVRGVGY